VPPAIRQPGRKTLSDLVYGRQVWITVRDHDRYGHTVGRVYVEHRDVNAELVRRDAAWVYRRYSDDPDLLRTEGVAPVGHRGLWGLLEAERVPLWEWRAATRHMR
jgi:endonuclease YncB( thermonuclease family)